MNPTAELIAAVRNLTRAIERNQQRLVNATDAARMLGISRSQFYASKPLTAIYIPEKSEPMYSVAEIDRLASDGWGTSVTQ